jgi:outer membrane protein OmpU
MKKVLFATTALIATAGMAAAEVRISGYGRFGLDYNEANDGRVVGGVAGGAVLSETSITSRLRLQFDMSTESDAGVTFGARFRAQAESRDGTPGGATFNGARFFARSGSFTVQVGNIGGALEFMPGLYLETRTAGVGIDGAGFQSLVTNTGGGSFQWDAYSSAGVGRNGVEVMYSSGAFGAHVSYSNSNDTATTVVGGVATAVAPGTERTAVHVSYEFGDWTVAAGYSDSNVVGEDKLVLTAQGDLGFAAVRVAYANNQDAGGLGVDIDKVGIYGKFDVGAATTLVAFVTSEDAPAAMASDGTGYGLHLSHDLGGGASIEAGWIETSSDNTTVQAGVYFSF